MRPPDDRSDSLRQDLIQTLQDALPGIEPPPEVREDMLKRILDRTVRTWRAWMNRARERLDD